MTDKAISPLRRRLIEDMTIRRLSPKTHYQYIRGTVNLSVRLSRMHPTGSGHWRSIGNPCCRFPPRPGMFGPWKLYARRQ